MASSPFRLLRRRDFGHDLAIDTSHPRPQRIDDQRLRDLVQTVGDPEVVAELSVPRSTVQGWLRGEYRPVVTADVLDMDAAGFQAEALTRVTPLGGGHLRCVVGEAVTHHQAERNHQGVNNRLLEQGGEVVNGGGRVARRTRLGGLLNDCYSEFA